MISKNVVEIFNIFRYKYIFQFNNNPLSLRGIIFEKHLFADAIFNGWQRHSTTVSELGD